MYYTLDTNILILILGGDEEIYELLKGIILQLGKFFIPSSVITELYSKPLSKEDESLLAKFFGDTTSIVSIDYPIARLAGDLRAKNHKMKLGDALVAAATISTKSILVTKNMRDFKNLLGVKFV